LRLRIVSLLLLVLCLATLPAAAQVLYDNGPINGIVSAWTINFGYAVSDSFTISGGEANVTGLSFGSWMFPGDVFSSVEVVITSSEFGGTTYADQVVGLTTSGCVLNQFGFNVCTQSGSFGTEVNLAAGTYWLTLENAEVPDDPVYWDENSGPSSASQNSIGTIPSESFTLFGGSGTGTGQGSTPEPSSIMLFGSGILGLAGALRRKLF
jgi:hypothetical protein